MVHSEARGQIALSEQDPLLGESCDNFGLRNETKNDRCDQTDDGVVLEGGLLRKIALTHRGQKLSERNHEGKDRDGEAHGDHGLRHACNQVSARIKRTFRNASFDSILLDGGERTLRIALDSSRILTTACNLILHF